MGHARKRCVLIGHVCVIRFEFAESFSVGDFCDRFFLMRRNTDCPYTASKTQVSEGIANAVFLNQCALCWPVFFFFRSFYGEDKQSPYCTRQEFLYFFVSFGQKQFLLQQYIYILKVRLRSL